MHLLSDMCNRIQIASNMGLKSVNIRKSKLVLECLTIVKNLGYISNFVIKNDKTIKVLLKYNRFESVLRNIYVISKPSKRVYIRRKKLFLKSRGDIIILSTSKGIMTDIECMMNYIGGEGLIGIR